MASPLIVSSDESDIDEKPSQQFTPEKSTPPSTNTRRLRSIECSYTDTVNIAKVARDVIAHLRRLTSPEEIEKMKKDIQDKENALQDGLWTLNQYKRLQDEITKAKQELAEVGTLENRYRRAIDPLLERWSLCTHKPDKCFLTEIDECISHFTRVTSEFVPMSTVKLQTTETEICFVCGRTGTLIDSSRSSGQLYCRVCKSGRQVLSYTNSRDMKGEDSSDREDDANETDRISLILKRFQGKQPQLPQSVYDSIEAYLNSRSVLKQSEIRELILKNPNERYGTSRALLQEAMRATHNERAYKDINAVAANIWGWQLPVLTQDFEDLIISDYRKTQAFYPMIRGKRRSRLNADYRLLRHLITRGFWHPILNDYLGPVTAEVNEYHANAWEKMCKLSGLPLVPMRV